MKNHPEGWFSSVEDSDCVDSRRRRFLAVSAAAILAYAIGTKGSIQDVFAENHTESSAAAESFDAEKKVDEIEAEFSKIRDFVVPQIDQYVDSEHLRILIRKVFEVFEANKKNPIRKHDDGKEVPFGVKIGFKYAFFGNEKMKYPFMFHGLSRTVKIGKDVDCRRPQRLCFLAHELVHVLNDNYYRTVIPEKTYRAYYGSKGHVAVPSEEAEAIAVHLEIANILSGGKLKKDILEGRKFSPETGSQNGDKFVSRMGEAYFKKPYNDFVGFVEEWYREKGVEIFNPDLTPKHE